MLQVAVLTLEARGERSRAEAAEDDLRLATDRQAPEASGLRQTDVVGEQASNAISASPQEASEQVKALQKEVARLSTALQEATKESVELRERLEATEALSQGLPVPLREDQERMVNLF